MFTPTEKSPEPDLGQGIIPKERYISPEFAEREWQKMWRRVWLIAGRVEQLQKTGDYFVYDIGKESIIIALSEDEKIRAFHNVCQHRGNQLINNKKGCRSAFKCAYHLWEWHLTGDLKCAPDPETFSQGLPNKELKLKQLQCDTWGGFIWINIDGKAEPLVDYLGVISQHLAPYHLERYYLAEHRSVVWECNWKTSLDAFSETYHAQGVHPQTLAHLDDVNVQIDLYDKHSRFLIPMMVPSPRHKNQTTANPTIATILDETVSLDASKYNGNLEEIRTDYQAAMRQQLTNRGVDVSDLNDDQISDDYHYTIFPNNTLNMMSTEFWLFRHCPYPGNPDKMIFDFQIFRPLEEGQQRPLLPKVISGYGSGFSLGLKVMDQDAIIVSRVQKSMHSEGFKGLWLGDQERRIRHFHHHLDKYLQETTTK